MIDETNSANNQLNICGSKKTSAYQMMESSVSYGELNDVEDNNESESPLPYDILRLIMEKLVEAERIIMRSVCKDWNRCKFNNRYEILPWLIYHDPKTQDFKLFNPSAQTSYVLRTPFQLHPRLVLDSRSSWLLIYDVYTDYSVYFYSPFASEVIKLPALDENYGPWLYMVSFSSVPTSSDCTVILQTCSCLEILICQVGDKTWRTVKLEERIGLIGSTGDYGCFYCIFFSSKTIRSFDVKTNEWKMLPDYPFILGGMLTPTEGYYNSNGMSSDIILGGKINRNLIQFWRLDRLEIKWILLGDKSFAKKVLFADHGGRFLSIPAVGNAKKFGGRIWDVTGKQYLITNDHKKSPEPIMCTWFGADDWPEFHVWIQPPFQSCQY